ncbi:MAG: aminotransferase class V-fold PLP-dependent enzyme, partial [Smithellaceae bacterium]|nr:aminotransferase class V-fold PLP-dependent enzyme [Smithellaceae bacterium]
MGIIYFDNAATSWPKPSEMINALNLFNEQVGANPGRSGHRLSIAAARDVLEAREGLAQLFGTSDPFRIVFTKNATEALNLAIFGFLRPGEHAIASAMEHNSIMRPLRCLAAQGMELSIARCSPRGEFDPKDIAPLIRKNTRAIYLTHASNVTGTIMPIEEVGRIARERGIVFCVDAAQTAGSLSIDVEKMNIDLLAFTGHKSLYGPQGTGGLYIRDGLEKEIRPLTCGGTGSLSESERQPDFMPDRYESGTPNAIGIAGLAAGVTYVQKRGIKDIRTAESLLTQMFLDGLRGMDGVTVYGPT